MFTLVGYCCFDDWYEFGYVLDNLSLTDFFYGAASCNINGDDIAVEFSSSCLIECGISVRRIQIRIHQGQRKGSDQQ